jgi:hypothetical protein
MQFQKRFLLLTAVAFFVLGGLSPTVPAIQSKDKSMPEGVPVLWRDPGDISKRDLLLGPGAEAMKPDLSKVTFIKEEKGGYSTKYRVKDGRGQEWVAKIGAEAQAETAAVRLLWAIGYMTEINYLVPRLEIEGKGVFENVRLEARPENVKRLDEWKWSDNPFKGTRELQGLIIMMAFLNNWDIKDTNNKILLVRNGGAGRGELHYIVSDLGATFGRVKANAPVVWRIRRNRNDPEDYSRDPFLEDVKGQSVSLFYKGKRQDLFDFITVSDARWVGSQLSKLSDSQIRDAFRAANYTPSEVRLLTGAVRVRINELMSVR